MIDVQSTIYDNVEHSQQEVYRFLSGPESHSRDGSANDMSNSGLPIPIEIISTHCAHVFLTETEAYKIKRAVSYSYLDMSLLARRHELCIRELHLNKSVLPEVYLDVVPITRGANGSLSINGDGEAVEWAVHMRRFDECAVLDNIAQRGDLSPAIARQLGVAIAEYHGQLVSESVVDGYERIREVVQELIDALNEHKGLFDEKDLARFREAGLQELEACHSALNNRASSGFVKRCHGDLHLRNLLMVRMRPLPFDALEFDERLATTDVLYDLAFLLMDLGHRGLRQQENIVLNDYLLHSDHRHYAALSLLPLFLFCRAGIHAMTSAQAAVHNADYYAAASQEARQYLLLASSYIVKRSPVLIAVGGLSGSGKSTVAAQLPIRVAGSPGAVLLRSDAARKTAMNMEEIEKLPASHYTAAAASENYQLLLDLAGLALDAGHSVVLDAVFLSAEYREAAGEIAASKGMPFYGLWLTAPASVLRKRIATRSNDASDATIAVMEKQLERSVGKNTWHAVDASGSVQATLDGVIQLLSSLKT